VQVSAARLRQARLTLETAGGNAVLELEARGLSRVEVELR